MIKIIDPRIILVATERDEIVRRSKEIKSEILFTN